MVEVEAFLAEGEEGEVFLVDDCMLAKMKHKR